MFYYSIYALFASQELGSAYAFLLLPNDYPHCFAGTRSRKRNANNVRKSDRRRKPARLKR